MVIKGGLVTSRQLKISEGEGAQPEIIAQTWQLERHRKAERHGRVSDRLDKQSPRELLFLITSFFKKKKRIESLMCTKMEKP